MPSAQPALALTKRTGEEGSGSSSSDDRQATGSPAWHALPVEAAFEKLASSAAGLDPQEAARRLGVYGANSLQGAGERSRLDILLAQVTNLPTGLLLGSTGLSGVLGDWLDASAILSVIGLNTAIGYQVEHRNESLLASWRRLQAGEAMALRGGRLCRVRATELVPGDVILTRAGDTVAADARVIEAHRLSCDEAALTGESEPQRKATAAVAASTILAERHSMLYAGTIVASGHGRALVVATGNHTEVAQVRRLLEAQKAPQTSLERRLEELVNRMAVAGVAAGLGNAALGWLRGRPLIDALRSAVALGVAAIPEGLPVVSTAALVRSMERMRGRGLVVRRVASAETLGGVTVVCADKTGTLTCNRMVLEQIDLGTGSVDPASLRALPQHLFKDPATLLLAAAILNSDVDAQRSGNEVQLTGSATELALVRAARAAGLSRTALRAAYPRRVLHERNGGVYYTLSLHDTPQGDVVAFVKGAPEQVAALCSHDLRGRFGAAQRRRLLARNEEMARDGLRVLALAWRRSKSMRQAGRKGGFTLIGLAGLRDPLRPGAADAVRMAAHAGIRTVILTGDQRRTAEAIGRAVGLSGPVLEGRQVERLLRSKRAADRRRLVSTSVFARVTPAHKVGIVRALREHGEVVAMAGDGVNDAPALKAADVGIAIGIGSADLARGAADMVLDGEDLRSILAAVGEGRIVQDNLRRTVHYQVASNLAEVALSIGANLFGRRDPLTPLQLLWINLISDTLPALALAWEPGRPDVLDRGPAAPDAPLLHRDAQIAVARDAAWLAGLSGLGLLIGGPATAFSTLIGAELGYTFTCRAPGTRPDRTFWQLTGAAAGVHMATFAVPPLRMLLGMPPLPSLAEVVGFVAGLAVPWVISSATDGAVIVRRGTGGHRPSEIAGRVPAAAVP
jgi:Ca2+-transporting ATPase